jgi:hypothetical protein
MQCVDVPFIPNELTVDSANALNVEAGTGYQARAFAAATEGFNAITDTQQRPVSTASIVGFTSILTDSSDINGGGTYTSSVHGALHEQITFRNTSSERKSATVDWTLSGNETLATVRSHIDVSGVLFGEASSQSFYQYYERSHDFHGVAEIGDPLLSQTWEIDPHAFLTANVTAILDVSSGVDSYGLCGGGLFFQPCPSATAIADWGHTALFGLVLDPGIQWSADSPYFRPEVVVNSESGTGTVDEPPTAYLIAATLSVMAFGAGRAKK